MTEANTKTSTVAEILAKTEPGVRKVVSEILAEIHPRLTEQKTDLAEIFSPESAGDFLKRITDFETLLSAEDSYEQTLEKFQGQINKAEKVRDEVLAELFEQIRPIESSYRQIWLFYDNARVEGGKTDMPVELWVYDADPAKMKNRESITLESIREFLASRNDTFNFRQNVCNLVVSGNIPMSVREALEEETWKWGMLLVTDLGDVEDFEDVKNNFRENGKFEFLKRPEDKAASDVVTVGYLKLRDAHWFEKQPAGTEDLYAPASVVFAGALARTDRSTGSVVQGPIGSRFGQIKGVDKGRVECRISQMELLSQKMQVIPIIRDANNHLCFYGCRTLADDPYGVYKFFTSYRVLMYLERRIATYLREVAGQVLTRDFMLEQVEKPIQRLLEEQKNLGSIAHYDLFVDKQANKRMQGICDIKLEVTPVGPAETFRIKIDVPDFEPDKSETGSDEGN